MRNYYLKIRLLVLEKHNNTCKHCGFKDIRALQIDHVNSNGAEERKKIGSTAIYKKALFDNDANYQVLCANCNSIKRVENKENRGPKQKVNIEIPCLPNIPFEDLYNKLPEIFSTKNLKDIHPSPHSATTNRLLKKWWKLKSIRKLEYGLWSKIKEL